MRMVISKADGGRIRHTCKVMLLHAIAVGNANKQSNAKKAGVAVDAIAEGNAKKAGVAVGVGNGSATARARAINMAPHLCRIWRTQTASAPVALPCALSLRRQHVRAIPTNS